MITKIIASPIRVFVREESSKMYRVISRVAITPNIWPPKRRDPLEID